ncbi:MAG: biotin--[acetyl-CoA-carboxylase] ligase [Canibacter sp.]
MQFPELETISHVTWVDSSPSTNAELSERARNEPLEPWTVLVTSNQTRGRGRHDRTWVTPADSALAVSVVIPVTDWKLPVSWVPLIAGSALAEALSQYLHVGVKWPNDVLAADGHHRGRKLVGILSELLSNDQAIVGSGINLFTAPDQLPTERATSLVAAGGNVPGETSLRGESGVKIADQLLTRYLTVLQELEVFARTDPERLRERIQHDSMTLGARVRAHLAMGETVEGQAVNLGEHGELTIELASGSVLAVSAGDVEHLR